MYVFRHRARVLALAAVISLLLSMMLTQTALASQEVFDIFDMNDRFATEKGASGLGKIRHTQEGSIVLDRLQAKNLAPKHDFEVVVTVGRNRVPAFVPVHIETSDPITSSANGNLEINNFFVGDFDPGVYRVDIFVVHTHPADDPPLTRDLLLACQPAPFVTVT